MTRIKSYWLIFVIVRTLFNLNHSKEQKSVFIQKLPLPSKTEFQPLVIKANMSHCNVIETNTDHIIKTYCQYHVVVDDRFYLKRKMKINIYEVADVFCAFIVIDVVVNGDMCRLYSSAKCMKISCTSDLNSEMSGRKIFD